MIPHMDLSKQFNALRPELLAKTDEIFNSYSYIHGRYVADFELIFAKINSALYCSGCSNGTSALFLALTACGVVAGDEVITTPHTFIATAEAISHTGATPVFVDIDPETYTIDPAKLEEAITDKTKAIIPVHLYGMPADMDPINDIAKKYGLAVVEDCAQAHLAEYKGRRVGTFGTAGAFSFYPGKNLGAYGDAGAVISDDEELIARVRKLLNHGRSEKYIHEIIGYNHRMDELQAGFLQVKMKYLERWTEARRVHAAHYERLLAGYPSIKRPHVPDYARHVYHLFVVRVSNRSEVIRNLNKRGIQTGIHYPLPLHLQPAYHHLPYEKGSFPITEEYAEQVLSLPMYPELTDSELETVCSALIDEAIK